MSYATKFKIPFCAFYAFSWLKLLCGVLADEPAHHSLNLYPLLGPDEDRFELWIGSLESNKLGLAIKLIHGGIVAIDQCDHDLTVFSSLLRLDDDDVPILNVLIDHRLSTHTQRKRSPMSL